MHTQEQIYTQLEKFRPIVGHHVHIHSSLKSVGEIEGNGEALLECLINFFTQHHGHVSFPTHTWNTNVLDLQKADTCTGMLSKLALKREDGVRSLHPTHSMVIFGESAAEHAKWDEYVTTPVSAKGCYGRLYEQDGYVLLIGLNQNKNTYIHAIEERLGIKDRVTDEIFDTVLIMKEGNRLVKPMHYVFEEYGDISHYFAKLEPAFRYHNCIVDGMIGEACVQLCNVRKMTEVLAKIHERSNYIEIFLDDKDIPKEWYE